MKTFDIYLLICVSSDLKEIKNQIIPLYMG